MTGWLEYLNYIKYPVNSAGYKVGKAFQIVRMVWTDKARENVVYVSNSK